MRSLLALAALATTASASPYIASMPTERTAPAIQRFGYRLGFGMLPLADHPNFVFSIGLGLDQRLVGKLRFLAEYDWLWTESRDPDAIARMAPAEYGDGHRVQLGLRYNMFRTRSFPLRMFVDAELGGGAALVTDNLTGTRFLPTGFTGIRFGYEVRTRNPDSPSHAFIAEFSVRAIAIDHGIGVMGGVGMQWGN